MPQSLQAIFLSDFSRELACSPGDGIRKFEPPKLGEFVLREQLGTGGCGAVYRAEQSVLGRRAAVNVLHQRLQSRDTWLLRFVRELSSPHASTIPNAAHIEDDGLLSIAMELIDGLAPRSPALAFRTLPPVTTPCPARRDTVAPMKHTLKRRLALRPETLRALQPPTLRDVHGGDQTEGGACPIGREQALASGANNISCVGTCNPT
jgi:hypothetical protein